MRNGRDMYFCWHGRYISLILVRYCSLYPCSHGYTYTAHMIAARISGWIYWILVVASCCVWLLRLIVAKWWWAG